MSFSVVHKLQSGFRLEKNAIWLEGFKIILKKLKRQFSFHEPFWFDFQKLLMMNNQPANNDLKKAWQESTRASSGTRLVH